MFNATPSKTLKCVPCQCLFHACIFIVCMSVPQLEV